MRTLASWAGLIGGLCASWGMGRLLGCPAQSEEPTVTVRAVEGLRFDPPRIRVQPGRPLRLRFENADTTAQPHNLVLVRPGAREAVLAAAVALGAEAPARAYVPSSPDVMASSRLLAAGEGEEIKISFPEEAGIYSIVCTFPGHGVLMFGAVYAGVDMPERIEDDRHVPKLPAPPVIQADPRPMVRRMFLPNASPAAIAVALPGDLNLCWDAGPCRLRYVWRGGFLDAEKHFTGKGQALARLGGPVVATVSEGFPVMIGGRVAGEVAFRGYSLTEGLPTFFYTIDGQLIKEGFSSENGILMQRFQLPGVSEKVEISGRFSPALTPAVDRGKWIDGVLRLSSEEAADVTLRYSLPGRGPAEEASQ